MWGTHFLQQHLLAQHLHSASPSLLAKSALTLKVAAKTETRRPSSAAAPTCRGRVLRGSVAQSSDSHRVTTRAFRGTTSISDANVLANMVAAPFQPVPILPMSLLRLCVRQQRVLVSRPSCPSHHRPGCLSSALTTRVFCHTPSTSDVSALTHTAAAPTGRRRIVTGPQRLCAIR